MINSSVNGKRRSKKGSKNRISLLIDHTSGPTEAASDAELKILADFESKVREKEIKKQQRQMEEKQRAAEREKKKREMEAFQQEIDKMLNDEEDDDPRQKKEVAKSYVPMNLGSIKACGLNKILIISILLIFKFLSRNINLISKPT